MSFEGPVLHLVTHHYNTNELVRFNGLSWNEWIKQNKEKNREKSTMLLLLRIHQDCHRKQIAQIIPHTHGVSNEVWSIK